MNRIRSFLDSSSLWDSRDIYWGLSDIVKLAAISLFSFLAVILIIGTRLTSDAAYSIGRGVSLLLLLLLHRHYRFWRSAEIFGLTLKDFREHFKAGVLWGLLVKFAPLLIILVILIPVSIIYGDLLANLELEAGFGVSALAPFSLEWFLVAFAAVVLAPLWEELLMRGILYPYFRRDFGRKVAIIGSSLAFALLHGIGFILIPTFIAGVALALLYEKTGLLAPCVVAHAVFNLIAVLAQTIPGLTNVL